MTSHDKEAAERESLADQWKRELIADIKAQRDGFYRHVKACKEGGWYRGQMEQHLAVLDSICAALSSPAEAGDYGFRPMLSAPQDGTEIELLIYHSTRHMYAKKDHENWEQIVVGKWIDFNGGGWTWRGIAGTPVGWRAIEARKEQG